MRTRPFRLVGLTAALGLFLSGAAFGQGKSLGLSFGVATGDYHNSFVGGLSGDFRLAPFFHGEVEFFYYRMPAPRSQTPGEAITSTALDVNFSLIVQADIPSLKVIPYVLLTGGRLYESETWKYSATKTRTHHSYTRWDNGLGAGLKVILGPHSGARLDCRWIRILEKEHLVPRFTLGYLLIL
jgi:hypothetical protein